MFLYEVDLVTEPLYIRIRVQWMARQHLDVNITNLHSKHSTTSEYDIFCLFEMEYDEMHEFCVVVIHFEFINKSVWLNKQYKKMNR